LLHPLVPQPPKLPRLAITEGGPAAKERGQPVLDRVADDTLRRTILWTTRYGTGLDHDRYLRGMPMPPKTASTTKTMMRTRSQVGIARTLRLGAFPALAGHKLCAIPAS
jgi:hypothetical protein